MPPQHLTRSAEELLHVVESLHVMPFPQHEEKTADRWSGPGYHVAVLAESRDFWEDRSSEVVEEAEEGIEADRVGLAALLTERWGAPREVDLWPRSGHPDPHFRAPEPMNLLCGLAGSMQVWRPPASDRWIALAVGQADPEFPLHLLAAFGEGSALPQ
ncbi:hypothetical protein [Streptomyces sp. NRRL F-2664]|uniref:hypothetical protein n=1 Tax=Streptomyces sp. NRRL F-2664 TaxID=1463842 RepID=UPI0004C8D67E|nr:hypothetical protein [Streptomyces sp. NRRL F-2664]